VFELSRDAIAMDKEKKNKIKGRGEVMQ